MKKKGLIKVNILIQSFFLDYEYFVLKKFKNINFDCVYFSTYDRDNDDKEQDIVNNILKQLNCKKWVFNKMHHEHHAMTGFYFSKFFFIKIVTSKINYF